MIEFSRHTLLVYLLIGIISSIGVHGFIKGKDTHAKRPPIGSTDELSVPNG